MASIVFNADLDEDVVFWTREVSPIIKESGLFLAGVEIERNVEPKRLSLLFSNDSNRMSMIWVQDGKKLSHTPEDGFVVTD